MLNKVPERFVIIDEDVNGEIKLSVKRGSDNKIFPATLKFTGRSCGVETINSQSSIHIDLKSNSETKVSWEMIIHEGYEGEEYQ